MVSWWDAFIGRRSGDVITEGSNYPLFLSQTESEDQRTHSCQSSAPIVFLLENRGRRSWVLCPRARREVQAEPEL